MRPSTLQLPLRIGVVGTEYRTNSHVDVIVSRWLEALPHDPKWGWTRSTARSNITSMYLDQYPDNDMARDKAKQFDVPLYDTVDAALCNGGDDLAVDGVLLIGEHGDYPYNDIEQHLHPRKELFDKIVATFKRTGRVAPVFCDKFLSWDFDWAKQMHETAAAMGFMLISGSSLPLCHTEPPMDLAGKRVTDVIIAFYGGDEAYGYHSMEFAQSILEQRAGGESGITAITVWRDEAVEREQANGTWSADLLERAVAACGKPGGNESNIVRDPLAFRVEYADGLRVTHVKQQGRITTWALATHLEGEAEPRAAAAVMAGEAEFFAHFGTLDAMIEEAFVTGQHPHSPMRNLLTTGATAAMMRARATPGVRYETPQLRLAYT